MDPGEVRTSGRQGSVSLAVCMCCVCEGVSVVSSSPGDPGDAASGF